MSEGTETAAQSAPETASPEQIEPTNLNTAPETETPETLETPEALPVEDFDEIEYDGERYKVPKKLKDGFLMQSDYTRKTQEVAEQRKQIEAQAKAIEERQKITEAHVKDVGRLMTIDERLTEFDKYDWSALSQNDPFRASELFQQRTLLREQRDGLARQIEANEWKRSQETQQSFAKRYAETNESLARDIKGWNQDTANKLRDFAIANGATEDDIRTMAVNAPMVKLLHKAWLGQELLSKQQTAAQTAEPRVEAKPLMKVTGAKASPAVSLADADMETYVAARKKQGFGRR